MKPSMRTRGCVFRASYASSVATPFSDERVGCPVGGLDEGYL